MEKLCQLFFTPLHCSSLPHLDKHTRSCHIHPFWEILIHIGDIIIFAPREVCNYIYIVIDDCIIEILHYTSHTESRAVIPHNFTPHYLICTEISAGKPLCHDSVVLILQTSLSVSLQQRKIKHAEKRRVCLQYNCPIKETSPTFQSHTSFNESASILYFGVSVTQIFQYSVVRPQHPTSVFIEICSYKIDT